MTELPFQKWFESDFVSDPAVRLLPFWTQQMWRCMLQTMWANHGWLPADEVRLAHMLGCDPRTLRGHLAAISGLLLVEIDPILGRIYRQKRIVNDWQDAVEDRKGT